MRDHDKTCMETTCLKPVAFRIFGQPHFGLCEDHCSAAFMELTEHLKGQVFITYEVETATKHPSFAGYEAEDLAYFRKRFAEGLRIPKEYLEEGMIPGEGDDEFEFPEERGTHPLAQSEESRKAEEAVFGEELGN